MGSLVAAVLAGMLIAAALAAFTKHARERWNVSIRTSALAAGTPLAYGRIVEWNGRPQADLFWGGESALYDRLAAQNLLAPLGLPKAVTDGIPCLGLAGRSAS